MLNKKMILALTTGLLLSTTGLFANRAGVVASYIVQNDLNGFCYALAGSTAADLNQIAYAEAGYWMGDLSGYYPPLHMAIRLGRTDMVKNLLNISNINYQGLTDVYGWTAQNLITSSGNSTMQAQLNELNSQGYVTTGTSCTYVSPISKAPRN